VRPAEGCDHPIAPRPSRSQVDEQDLIFAVVNNFAQFASQRYEITSRQAALENGKLNVIALIAHGLEHVP